MHSVALISRTVVFSFNINSYSHLYRFSRESIYSHYQNNSFFLFHLRNTRKSARNINASSPSRATLPATHTLPNRTQQLVKGDCNTTRKAPARQPKVGGRALSPSCRRSRAQSLNPPQAPGKTVHYLHTIFISWFWLVTNFLMNLESKIQRVLSMYKIQRGFREENIYGDIFSWKSKFGISEYVSRKNLVL